MVLRHINPIISADLMYTMMCMGHGDELVISDLNFPSVSLGKRVIPYQGQLIEPLLDAILYHFPLDYRVEHPVMMMEIPPEAGYVGDAQQRYEKVLANQELESSTIGLLRREEFYKRSSQAFAIITTSDGARFANIILRKGIITA